MAELDVRAMKIEQAKTMSTASMLFATVAARDFASCFISNHRFRLPHYRFTFESFLRFLLESNLASECDCDIILNKVIYGNKPGNSQVIFGRSSCDFAYPQNSTMTSGVEFQDICILTSNMALTRPNCLFADVLLCYCLLTRNEQSRDGLSFCK